MADYALGFDTSAAHCAAALICGDKVVVSRPVDRARGQAEHLLPLLQEVLDEAGLKWTDLSVLGVGTGPGNFTGIRIAVAAARGLALALNIPAIGIGACEARAWGRHRPCRIVIPARAGEVIWQDFGPQGPLSDPASTPADLLPDGPAEAHHTAIAEGVAHLALSRLGTEQPRPAPIYLRPADAAPARDSGPLILS